MFIFCPTTVRLSEEKTARVIEFTSEFNEVTQDEGQPPPPPPLAEMGLKPNMNALPPITTAIITRAIKTVDLANVVKTCNEDL